MLRLAAEADVVGEDAGPLRLKERTFETAIENAPPSITVKRWKI